MAESHLNEVIRTSLEKIKELAGNETVVGEPISLPGVTIIPVSRVSIGFATGGLDFPGKGTDAPTAPKFGGGGGTGITVAPIAFLVVSESGRAEILPIHTPSEADSLDKITALIEKTPEIMEKIKAVFAKKKKKEEEDPVTD